MSNILKTTDNELKVIVLINGVNNESEPFYAFMYVKPSNLHLLNNIGVQTNIDQIGDLIVMEKGISAPPDDVMKVMIKEFGFDPDYVNKYALPVTFDALKQMDEDDNLSDD